MSLKDDRRTILFLHLLKAHNVSANEAGYASKRACLIRKSSVRASNLCLAGSAALRSMERDGLVVSFPSDRTQWACKMYALTQKGKDLAESLRQNKAEKRC